MMLAAASATSETSSTIETTTHSDAKRARMGSKENFSHMNSANGIRTYHGNKTFGGQGCRILELDLSN